MSLEYVRFAVLTPSGQTALLRMIFQVEVEQEGCWIAEVLELLEAENPEADSRTWLWWGYMASAVMSLLIFIAGLGDVITGAFWLLLR
jgi:hypothetical protein